MSIAPDAVPPQETGEAPAEKAQPKVETIEIFGKAIPTAEVADYFDPDCELRCELGSLTRGVPAPKDMKELRGKILQVTTLCPCAVRRYKRSNPPGAGAPIAGPLALAAAAEDPDAPRPEVPNPRADQVRRKRARQDELRGELEALRTAAAARTADLRDELAAVDAGGRAAQQLADSARTEAARLAQLLEDARTRAAAAQATAEEAMRQAVALETELARATSDIDAKREQRLIRDIDKIERQIGTIVAYHPEAGDGR